MNEMLKGLFLKVLKEALQDSWKRASAEGNPPLEFLLEFLKFIPGEIWQEAIEHIFNVTEEIEDTTTPTLRTPSEKEEIQKAVLEIVTNRIVGNNK